MLTFQRSHTTNEEHTQKVRKVETEREKERQAKNKWLIDQFASLLRFADCTGFWLSIQLLESTLVLQQIKNCDNNQKLIKFDNLWSALNNQINSDFVPIALCGSNSGRKMHCERKELR